MIHYVIRKSGTLFTLRSFPAQRLYSLGQQLQINPARLHRQPDSCTGCRCLQTHSVSPCGYADAAENKHRLPFLVAAVPACDFTAFHIDCPPVSFIAPFKNRIFKNF